jgi:hypothetical protein
MADVLINCRRSYARFFIANVFDEGAYPNIILLEFGKIISPEK